LGVHHAVLVVSVVVVVVVVVVMSVVGADMLNCSVDTHHCSVDTSDLFHAYFFYVSAERLFSENPYHTPDKSQTHHKQCLFDKTMHISTINQIRSDDHQLYNIAINKLGLCPFDDKRYILDDGVDSLAYVHWRI
jgi:hypothetical protein